MFPSKLEEILLILNLKYEEIKTNVYTKLEDFCKNCTELGNRENDLPQLNPINKIFKKILLENNRIGEIDILGNTDENHNRVLIVSDGDYFQYDQKLLFYIMRENIVIDCISLTNNKNVLYSYLACLTSYFTLHEWVL